MHHFPVCLLMERLVRLQKLRQVFPSSGRCKHLAVYRSLDAVEMVSSYIQIRENGRMNLCLISIFLPNIIIFFHIYLLNPIQRHHVKIPYRLIILRRIARGNDNPAFRHLLVSECLALQELEHGRRQRLGYAVDLIDKQDAFRNPGGLDLFIDGRDDLAHRIFRHGILLSAKSLFPYKRKPDGALPGVMRNGIGDQANLALLGNLLHNLRLPDSRRPHQQDRALADCRYHIVPIGVFFKICLYGIFNFLLRSFYVHGLVILSLLSSPVSGGAYGLCRSSSSSTSFMAHGGTSTSS